MNKSIRIALIAILATLQSLTTTTLFSQQSENIPSLAKDSGYINVDGGKLFYEIAGKGENIVLLHDGMLPHEVWDAQFPVLANNYRVVRYDRRTYGKSSDPTAPYSDIEDLNQLFTQLKIDKAVVFGMSAGGGLAIDFTLKYPGKVTALVLVGAVVSGYGYSPHMTNRGGHLTNPAELSDPKKVIKYFGWDDPYEIYSENIKAKEKFSKILENNLHQVQGNYQKPLNRPAAKFLSEIKVPALVLVGEFDIPDVHAHAGVIENGIPGAKREIILKSGHLIPLEQPEVFNSSVQDFLNKTEFKYIVDSLGVDAAVNYFEAKRKSQPDIVLFTESEMNKLGYQYFQSEKTKEAIKLFKLNTIAYPNSGNTYDSFAEALLQDGQTALAIENYEKAFELDPANTHAKEVVTAFKKSTGGVSATQNLLRYPESIIYDKAHKRYLLSNYLTGTIMQADANGKQSVLAESQPPIQGLEIVGNTVYVGAQNSVRGFDLETGKMVMNVTIPDVSNLNDVTADENGNIYAADVFGTRIFKIRIKDNSYSVFVDGKGINQPNGIFYDKTNKRILVCSFRKNSPIQAINLADSTVTTLVETNINNCDGIVMDKYGRCYVTSWITRSIYRFDKDFLNPPTVFYTNAISPADISYDQVHNAIAVPLMLVNSYDIVPVDPPKKK